MWLLNRAILELAISHALAPAAMPVLICAGATWGSTIQVGLSQVTNAKPLLPLALHQMTGPVFPQEFLPTVRLLPGLSPLYMKLPGPPSIQEVK